MSVTTRLVTALVLLVAVALRFTGLDFGLPMAESRPDEVTIAFQAMKFGRGDLNPHSFNYPSFFKYVVFACFGGWYVVGKLIGEFATKDEFLREFFAGGESFRLIMRILSASMGTIGVALLLKAPGRLWSAALLAVCFLHVRDSHFGVTDVTMVTLVTAAVLACLRLEEDGTVRAALLAGALAGLATSTKYNAAVVGLPLLLAGWFGGGPRLAVIAVVAMGGAFVFGTPYAVLDARTFLKDFLYEATHLDEGHFVAVGSGWLSHLRSSLRYGLGLPLLGIGLFGIAFGLWRGGRRAAILYAFPIVYYVLIGRGETAFYRYILPVVPFICIAAGAMIERLPRLPRGLLFLGLAGPTFVSSVQAVRLFVAGDTRAAMGAWIEANVPTESLIVHGGAYTGAPMLQRNVANQTREYAAKQGRADSAGFRKPDDMKWYEADRPMYDVQFIRKEGIDFVSQVDVDALFADPPEWLLLERYPLVHYAAVPEVVHHFALERYELVHEEVSWNGQPGAIFDQQDAFYMPVTHFRDFSRIGPNLRLYRRR